jgi:hypothetical protein
MSGCSVTCCLPEQAIEKQFMPQYTSPQQDNQELVAYDESLTGLQLG